LIYKTHNPTGFSDTMAPRFKGESSDRRFSARNHSQAMNDSEAGRVSGLQENNGGACSGEVTGQSGRSPGTVV
jgi:hypothetical protein